MKKKKASEKSDPNKYKILIFMQKKRKKNRTVLIFTSVLKDTLKGVTGN